MDRPFRELHELYKLLFQRAEAQAKAQKEKEEQERKEKLERDKYKHSKRRMLPPDAQGSSPNNVIQTPSPLEAEAFEDVLEEMAEGGVI